MKKFYLITSALFIVLGIIHTACTPVFYTSYSLDALWFAGTGLSVVFLGQLNISGLKTMDSTTLDFCIASNILCAAFLMMITVMIMQIQAFVGMFLILSMSGSSIYFRLQNLHK